MSRKTTSSVGAFHPILFFVVIYGISLFLAFFVCSSVYYSINDNEELTAQSRNAATNTNWTTLQLLQP
jgi:flagellar biosynthesis protein FliP